jgi:asparagine N-glycosylation enzyme membrane subunit Stt3
MSELDLLLSLILDVAIVAVAIITVVVAFYLARLFKGTPFERPWKTLYLVPIFMAGIGICELLGVSVLRIRTLLSLAALLAFLYSICSFYRAWQRTRAVEVLGSEEK